MNHVSQHYKWNGGGHKDVQKLPKSFPKQGLLAPPINQNSFLQPFYGLVHCWKPCYAWVCPSSDDTNLMTEQGKKAQLSAIFSIESIKWLNMFSSLKTDENPKYKNTGKTKMLRLWDLKSSWYSGTVIDDRLSSPPGTLTKEMKLL